MTLLPSSWLLSAIFATGRPRQEREEKVHTYVSVLTFIDKMAVLARVGSMTADFNLVARLSYQDTTFPLSERTARHNNGGGVCASYGVLVFLVLQGTQQWRCRGVVLCYRLQSTVVNCGVRVCHIG